jgi:hypothetical protein
MQKLTITVDDAVYVGLHQVIGRGNISRFMNNLVRPHVVRGDRAAIYAEMAADTEREREALEWAEGLMGDLDA